MEAATVGGGDDDGGLVVGGACVGVGGVIPVFETGAGVTRGKSVFSGSPTGLLSEVIVSSGCVCDSVFEPAEGCFKGSVAQLCLRNQDPPRWAPPALLLPRARSVAWVSARLLQPLKGSVAPPAPARLLLVHYLSSVAEMTHSREIGFERMKSCFSYRPVDRA